MIAQHQYEVYIRATPEQVWSAITDPEMTRQYFHGTSFDRPPVQGEHYSTSTADGRPAVDGTIEVLDPPYRMVQTWHTLYDAELAAEPVSQVEWVVEDAGEGLTRLRVVHGDLAQSPQTWANVRHGWVWILDGLKTLLETGSPLPAGDRRARPARRRLRRLAPDGGDRGQQLGLGADREGRPLGRRRRGDAAAGLRRALPLGARHRPRADQRGARRVAGRRGAAARRRAASCHCATPTSAWRSARSTASGTPTSTPPARPGTGPPLPSRPLLRPDPPRRHTKLARYGDQLV